MLNRMKSDYVSFIILVGGIFFFIEVLFFNTGLIFSFLFSGILLYFGKRKWNGIVGKALFLIGLISFIVTIFNMMAMRFILLATVVYFIYKFFQAKKQPVYLEPTILEATKEVVHRQEQRWFTNKLIGKQNTPDTSYIWDDINIQCGISDTVIDLSNTVLPKGEALIYIRNLVGNIQIHIPYEVELSVRHSGLVGSLVILEMEDKSIFNQTIHFQTEDYKDATQKVKIVTSVMVGSLEVKRI
ncbi:hypothetical protein FIU87_17055 [Bacillus sp. THAF10]|uniref:cell wall-active antibiotics response protein LiaF n=1 Tax=Bacillus sp. THAF10 TaxID=2587848 RepID=UPI0012695BCA|nr:cell wall-active antibiotics response protein LiaF [Bacillus sp. THAF10]QFT90351.1 hypothetical protein FIU87_17055 [Bacillus sp. THAF10]